jgi:hypothetical protein
LNNEIITKGKQMKNKLLTTTAIAGLLISGAAVAQTTISGNLDLTYKAIGNKNTKENSVRGFGKETQINIANKGKLNNGVDYVAGFSIEHDGQELGATGATTSGTAMFNENVYIDFIMGKTTLTIGADHIQNPDFEATNITGMGDLDEIISGVRNVPAGYVNNIGSPYSAFGLGLIQDLGVGKFSVYYTPSATAIAGDSHGGFSTFSHYVDGTNSTYEVGFRGDLGVKGLDASYFFNSTDSNDRATNTNSADNYKLQAKYTNSGVTVAASQAEQEVNTAATNTTKKSTSMALGYAVNKDVTISYGRAKTDSGLTASPADEKIQAITVGYNLGPVAAGFSVGKVENYAHTAASDGKTAQLTLSTRF